jgi:rfaE bifunctional protein, domain I/rfaE bifunctional protein, domain II
MKPCVPDFASAHVLVVGDVMLDRYWHGDTSRISPEAPVPIVRVTKGEERPGGAANVALNVGALGARATVLGIVGEDEAADTLAGLLESKGIRCALLRLPGFKTISKLRVLSRHQQLIRLDLEEKFGSWNPAPLISTFHALLENADLLVLSDYGKGTLKPLCALIDGARAAGKAVLVDPKGRDFSIYRGVTAITPNLVEFEAVAGHCPSETDLVERGMRMLHTLDLEALLITRGEQGMTLLQTGRAPLHLHAQAREVYDVTGAGDTVIAVLGAALAAGSELASATALANVAAGIVVGKLGTASVTASELRRALAMHQARDTGVVTEQELLLAVADARAQGETIVMTNGCFDLLHAGHVAYLAQAQRLGDRLVVAVNDDASVRRLKGPPRPVNTVYNRMAVLAALSAVDWVVPFAEDTPERLIRLVRPNILVKGGDYHPQTIVGADFVTSTGGRVLTIDYQAGCSTSKIIETILAVGTTSGNAYCK